MRSYLLPAAILVAGLILAIAIYAVRTGTEPAIPEGDVSFLRGISPDDHLVGSPEALVTVVTYSDIDCAYCKQYQRTMEQIMTEYGADGRVAWVYRHLPLLDKHPEAALHAQAAECAASLAGGDTFWRFIGAMQEQAPGEATFESDDYDILLPRFSIPAEAFTQCMDTSRFADRVALDARNAVEIGATAAPFTVLLIEGANPVTISGAPPYPAMRKAIEQALTLATPQGV